MNFSTTLGISPMLARLPRGLVLLCILSLVWQIARGPTAHFSPALPLPVATARWQKLPRRRPGAHPRFRLHFWPFLVQSGLRVLARELLLLGLLHLSGGWAWAPWSRGVLLLPVLQMLGAVWILGHPLSTHPAILGLGSRWLQRAYQLTLVWLLVSAAAQLFRPLHGSLTGLFCAVGLGTLQAEPLSDVSATPAHPEIQVTATGENHYCVTLRGAFTLVWEPRDSFERWLLILFLRRLCRVGEEHPYLTQQQVGAALGVSPSEVSVWERHVREHSWHYLSDRFRHALHSLLPDAELSQAILKVWVPAFWLSAWDVRDRLIQLGVLPNREALAVDALYVLAHHTGFQIVRDVLLERFDLQGGHIMAREHWWLEKLLALNERLIHQLERGERFSPQELVEIEALRLKSPEKPADAEAPPLAALLKNALFAPPPKTAPAPPEPVHCTYCDSDQVAPKSKTPRLRTLIDEFGVKQVVEVLRFYCHNPACPYRSFTHLPPGILPHSPYPVQVRLLAVEVYVQLLSTYRRSARMFTVKASTVYHWVASVSPAALCLAAYLGVVRTTGIVGVDDKWIKVCSPSAVRLHGTRPRAVWRYVYVAVDAYSLDLLAIQVYPTHSDESVRLFLLELKAKGVRPRVVVSDLDPAYGRMLPLVFPQAVHHECIFHAIQNALNQMTQVYGRNYLEKVPDTAPLHEAITHLFHAQTQKTVHKRFAGLMEMRSGYVTHTPEIACVFDSLERHFPKLVNAIESPDIPSTNNATELVIRRFDQHYQSMCGFDSIESAQVYLRLFELVYRITPFADDGRPAIRGKCPLELAGYDLKALPIADFFINLQLPALTIPAQPLSP